MDSNLLIGLVVIVAIGFFLKSRKDKSSASTTSAPAKAPTKAKKAPAKAKKAPAKAKTTPAKAKKAPAKKGGKAGLEVLK